MIYRFGPFEMDAAARELRAGGHRVETEPKAFDLLVYLAEHRDRAVSKDELLTAVWPRQIVTETALTRAVMKARRAVGDDPERQAVIRTVHGHGYRWVAELLPAQAPAGAPVPDTGAAAAGRDGAWWRRSLPVAAALLLALGAALFALRDEAPPAEAGALAVLPVTNRVADSDLDWARLGLMSLMQRMFDEAGVRVVADRQVLRLLDGVTLDAAPGPELFAELRRQAGAATVLYTELTREGGLDRLSATLVQADGRRTRRVIVGDSPAALAADMARVVARLLTGSDLREGDRFAKYSTDPFVNEMYARALDLELQGRLEEARQLFRIAAEQEPALFWLRYEIALCTRDLREWEAAGSQFEALFEEARDAGDARAQVVTLNSHGVMHFNRNRYDEARALYAGALEVATAGGLESERATVLINLALIASARGELARSAALYDEAMAAYRAADIPVPPTLHNNYAGLLARLGRLPEARGFAERAVEEFRVMGHRRFEAPALNRLARILRRQGDLDGAIRRHEQALAIYRELGDPVGELSAMGALTAAYRLRGDLSRAEANAREVLERARLEDDTLVLGDALMQLGDVDLALSRNEAAREAFGEARRLFAEVGDDQGLRAAETGLARTALVLGDHGLADRIARGLLESAQAAGRDNAVARARLLSGHVAAAGGRPDLAADHFRAALEYARASADAALLPEAAIALAALELGRGNRQLAAELADEARALAPADHDFLRFDARLALEQGDRARARELLENLRRSAGEAWTAADEALLARARE